MALFRAGMPNIPIFWYAFLRCGTLKSWVSASKLEKPSVPKKPRLGSRRWQRLQVWTVSEVMLK